MELIKESLLEIVQTENFGAIHVRLRKSEDKLLEEVDYES
jgi:chromatin segregation and condensation protein Rec8/ScpA/Scc1 (kleisin family)